MRHLDELTLRVAIAAKEMICEDPIYNPVFFWQMVRDLSKKFPSAKLDCYVVCLWNMLSS
jgi:hypothetical protein